MKKIKMSVKEFLQTRQVFEKFRIAFTYGYKKGGTVIIQADKNLLETIGY